MGIPSPGLHTCYGHQVTLLTHVKPVEHVTVLCTKFLNIFSFQKLIFSMLCMCFLLIKNILLIICVCVYLQLL